MAVLLEVKSGQLGGSKIPIPSGGSSLIGRAPDRAQFVVPHDNAMSGVHFAVECGANGCRVIDKKSTNGTFLNGAKVQEAMLASGDEIKAGQTTFVVRVVPDNQLPAGSSGTPAAVPASKEVPPPAPAPPRPAPVPPPQPRPNLIHRLSDEPKPAAANQAVSQKPVTPAPVSIPAQPYASPPSRPGQPPALAIGSWTFSKIPEGWQVQEGLGIQIQTKDESVFPSNIGAMEEPLGQGITLSQYVEAQTKMFRQYLREPKLDAALPPKIPGATETMALDVRYSTKDGPMIYYRRVYARSGKMIGVLTLTTLEKDLSSVRPAYDAFLSAASFVAQT